MNLPDLDGYEVCRRLKSAPETRDILVIFITANDDLDSLVQGFGAGAVDFVGKPFRNEEVVMRTRTHPQIARLTAQLAARADELTDEVGMRRLLKTQLSELAEREAMDWAWRR